MANQRGGSQPGVECLAAQLQLQVALEVREPLVSILLGPVRAYHRRQCRAVIDHQRVCRVCLVKTPILVRAARLLLRWFPAGFQASGQDRAPIGDGGPALHLCAQRGAGAVGVCRSQTQPVDQRSSPRPPYAESHQSLDCCLTVLSDRQMLAGVIGWGWVNACELRAWLPRSCFVISDTSTTSIGRWLVRGGC